MSKPALAAIFGISGTALSEEECRFFMDYPPAGFILFRRNCENKTQLRDLTASLRTLTNQPHLPILIDQEGGRVARLKPPHWRYSPAPGWLLKHVPAEHSTEAITLHYRLIAEELYTMGITVNCAPMLDIRFPDSHEIIGDRALGDDAETVFERGEATCKGLKAGGVLPVIKHIPGHGRARADSHESLPIVNTTLEELERTDFIPFKALHNELLGMTAHITYPALDNAECATLSPKLIAYIRKKIGFTGLLMTDDLSMDALSGDFTTRTEAGLNAGCDLILHCNGKMDEMQAVATALPPLAKSTRQKLTSSIQKTIESRTPLDVQATVTTLRGWLGISAGGAYLTETI